MYVNIYILQTDTDLEYEDDDELQYNSSHRYKPILKMKYCGHRNAR